VEKRKDQVRWAWVTAEMFAAKENVQQQLPQLRRVWIWPRCNVEWVLIGGLCGARNTTYNVLKTVVKRMFLYIC